MINLDELLAKNWLPYLSESDGDERCGIVLQNGEIKELENRSSYPRNSFVILESDMQEYIGQIAATWHTHPRGPNNLSIDDYNMFSEYPDWHHFILTSKSISAYKYVDGYVMNLKREPIHG